MNTVAAGDLTECMGLSLDEFKYPTVNDFILLKRFLQVFHGDSDGSACELHTAVCWRFRRSNQMQAADQTFSSDHADFSGKSKRGDGENRRKT